MSKVVKGVGNVVKSVGRAVGNVVKGAANLVKKVATSKIGKIVLGAAAIYFGGAALTGAFNGATGAGSSGFWGTIGNAISGTGTGLNSAWTGLANAGGNLFTANFDKIGGDLAGAFKAATPTAATGTLVSTGGAVAGGASTLTSSAAGGGVMSGLLSSPYAAPALISAGMQGVSAIGQGYMAKQAQDRQERLDAEARDRYGKNVGARLFTPGSMA